MFLSTNALGMVVRGFFKDQTITDFKNHEDELIRKEAVKDDRADTIVTIISIIVLAIFVYLLYRYVNIWAVLAVVLFMVARLPDLLWEIEHGRKITKKDKPKGWIYSITTVLFWLVLPVIWYSIYLLLSK